LVGEGNTMIMKNGTTGHTVCSSLAGGSIGVGRLSSLVVAWQGNDFRNT
jgi:hypothetical protein